MGGRPRCEQGWVRRMRWAVAACLVGGVAASVAGPASAQEPERVEQLWALAEVGADGSVAVTEVIDYDFGSGNTGHGIYRDIPGLSVDASITVTSETAPDDVQVAPEGDGVRVRIGDPAQTVTGEHRYRIEYQLDDAIRDGRLDWEAVGTQWETNIHKVEVHLVAPFELTDAECFFGPQGSDATWPVSVVEPGHDVVELNDIPPGYGVSLEIVAGDPLARAPVAPSPAAPPASEPPPLTTVPDAGDDIDASDSSDGDGGVNLGLPLWLWITLGWFVAIGFVAVWAHRGGGRGGGRSDSGYHHSNAGSSYSSFDGGGSSGGGGGDVGGGDGGGGGGSW